MARLTVRADNMFNLGWLTRLLGMPRIHPDRPAGIKKESFDEGWDMCDETSPEWRIKVLQPMIDKGQIIIEWEAK